MFIVLEICIDQIGSYAFNLFDKMSHLHLNVWIYYVENLFCINFQIDFGIRNLKVKFYNNHGPKNRNEVQVKIPEI